MYRGKPIIGLVGGIGAGKSFVASLLGEMGCLVIDSDVQVRRALERAEVRTALAAWWGGEVLRADGAVDRSAVARRVFGDAAERKRLEGLIHPIIAAERDRVMAGAADNPQVVGYVWDAPLLFEAGLGEECDAVIFVDAPEAVRLERVRVERGWNEAELKRREFSQWGLDKKRQMSDYVVSNTADADQVRGQVRRVLSRILAEKT